MQGMRRERHIKIFIPDFHRHTARLIIKITCNNHVFTILRGCHHHRSLILILRLKRQDIGTILNE